VARSSPRAHPYEALLRVPEASEEATGEYTAEFVGPHQPLFWLVHGLVRRGAVGPLAGIFEDALLLHDELNDLPDRMRPGFAAEAGPPFRDSDIAPTHALRAMAALGLCLVDDRPRDDALSAALNWFRQARSVPEAGFGTWRTADLAGRDHRLATALESLRSVAGDDREKGIGWQAALTLCRLAAQDQGLGKPESVGVLFDRGLTGLQGKLRMAVAPEFPAALFPHPERMALFRADPVFQAALAAAWVKAGAGRLCGTAYWWLESAEGPITQVSDESLGAAFAVVLDELVQLQTPWKNLRVGQRLRSGHFVVGALDGDGDGVRSVGGYATKLTVVPEHATVIIPDDDRSVARLAQDNDIDIVQVRTWREAAGRARCRSRFVRVVRTLVGAVVVVAVTGGLGIASAVSSAEDRQHVKQATDLAARSRTLAGRYPDEALLLAAAAWKIAEVPEARAAMLNALAQPSRAVLTGGSEPVNNSAFTRDGRTLITESGNSVRFWDTSSRHESALPITGPRGGFAGLSLSADGRTLAIGEGQAGPMPDGEHEAPGGFGAVRLVDVASRHELAGPLHLKTRASSVALSPDGSRLATVDTLANVSLWDVAARRRIRLHVQGSGAGLNHVAFSPDGRILALTRGGSLTFWNPVTGRQIGGPLNPGRSNAYYLAFAPDGRSLAVTDGGALQLYDVATRRLVHEPTKTVDAEGPVNALGFSPDGTTIATGGFKGVVRFWDAATGRESAPPLTGHTDSIETLAFSPDGRWLATGSYDRTARLWTVAPRRWIGQVLFENTEGVTDLGFSPDGRLLATAGFGAAKIHLTSDYRQTGPTLDPGAVGVTSLAFSPDGRILVTGDGTGGDTGYGRRGAVSEWNPVSHQLISPPEIAHTTAVSALAFAPDGRSLATAGYDGMVQIWETTGLRKVGTAWKASDKGVQSLVFNPDGRSLLTGGGDGVIRWWDPATHREQGPPLRGHSAEVTTMRFSPDKTLLASGSADGSVVIWSGRRQQGAPVQVIAGGHVASVAFSPDGATLATGAGSLVQLWDLRSRQPIGVARPGDVAAFAPDGRTLITGSDVLRVWDVAAPADLVGQVCQAAARDLTREERSRLIPFRTDLTVCPR
jgi:WD40 repeat protein